jgi:hypothetical protein
VKGGQKVQINTTVILGDGDSFAYTADAAAAQVLAALGGNPTKDFATVYVQQQASGSSGTAPPPPGSSP